MKMPNDQSKSANGEALSQSFEQFAKDMPTLWQSLGAGIGGVWNDIKNEASESPVASPTETGSNSPAASLVPEAPIDAGGELPEE